MFRDADGFGDMAVVRVLRSSDLTLLGDEIPIDMNIFDNDWSTIRVPLPKNSIGTSVVIEWNFISDDSLDAFSGLSLDDVTASD